MPYNFTGQQYKANVSLNFYVFYITKSKSNVNSHFLKRCLSLGYLVYCNLCPFLVFRGMDTNCREYALNCFFLMGCLDRQTDMARRRLMDRLREHKYTSWAPFGAKKNGHKCHTRGVKSEICHTQKKVPIRPFGVIPVYVFLQWNEYYPVWTEIIPVWIVFSPGLERKILVLGNETI